MHTVKKTITKNQTLVEDLTEGASSYEYLVKKGAFTLVLTGHKKNVVDASVVIRLQGRGTSAKVVGCIMGAGDGAYHLHTLQQHEAPETTSDLLVKTVLSDASTSHYEGAIRVEKEGQKTDAYQRNENLLLSPHAKAVSSPGLEILANDVRCTHGATAGPVNVDALWYLASRGIDQAHGEALIVDGFLSAALERIEDHGTRADVRKTLGLVV